MELEKEHDKLSYIQSKLQGTLLLPEDLEIIQQFVVFDVWLFLFPSSEEHKLNESFQEELKSLKLDRDKVSFEIRLCLLDIMAFDFFLFLFVRLYST